MYADNPDIKINKNSTPSETLYAEAKWLRTAHTSRVNKKFSKAYKDGFAAAIEWVEFHAKQVKEKEEK